MKLVRPFGFTAPKTLNYLAFQSFDFGRTWWRLFQKRVVRTKFDIYDFIILFIVNSVDQNSSLKSPRTGGGEPLFY
jgi:hypothetical protein